MHDDAEYEISSGNVFADLGFPDPEEHLMKAKIVARVDRTLQEQSLDRSKAAKRLGLTTAQLADLLRGRFSAYSVGKLTQFADLLNADAPAPPDEPNTDDRKALLDIATP